MRKMNWLRIVMGGVAAALFLTLGIDPFFGLILTGTWLLRIENGIVLLQNGP